MKGDSFKQNYSSTDSSISNFILRLARCRKLIYKINTGIHILFKRICVQSLIDLRVSLKVIYYYILIAEVTEPENSLKVAIESFYVHLMTLF